MDDVLYTPTVEQQATAQITHFLVAINKKYNLSISDYHTLYTWSVENPALFWQEVWNFFNLIATTPATHTVTHGDKMPGAQWFPGAKLNFAENLLRFRDEQLAIIFCGENGQKQTLTYRALYQQVAKLAHALKKIGVQPHDRVAGFLPNLPQTIIAMLATTSLGAIWSSCSPDFGRQGILDRFGQIQPKILFTADGYYFKGQVFNSLPIIKSVINELPELQKIIVIPYAQQKADITDLPHAIHYHDFINNDAEEIPFTPLPFEHPVYIMYSSGTTGKPKCIVHSVGGTLIQHIKELGLHVDLHRHDRLFYYTTCGWMMWNWMVSGLALGATLILYDGHPFHPNPQRLINLIDEEKISVFGTSAKYIATLEKMEVKPIQSNSLESLRMILSTGSPLAPESFDYVYHDIKKKVHLASISGGTDIVSCFALGCPLLPVYRGELQCRGLGMAVAFFDSTGKAVVEQKGELVCTKSFPSMPVGFWQDPSGKKYHDAYFSRFNSIWTHGDFGELTARNSVIIYGRSDAVLNPGGIRIGTAEIYRQVEKIPVILEACAVGQAWQNDERIILFVRLQEGAILDQSLIKLITTTIRENTTPRHVPAKIIAVPDIPRTRNGKIAELAVKRSLQHEPITNLEAISNPEVLAFYQQLVIS